jgi:hypothetical protein
LALQPFGTVVRNICTRKPFFERLALMTDNELVALEERIVDMLAEYRDACKEFDIYFEDQVENLVDRAKE